MTDSVVAVFQTFGITDEEYRTLDSMFGNLCKYAAWKLLKKNYKNSHTDDIDDVVQELIEAVIHAGCYYKRQVYIEDCLVKARKYAKDRFVIEILDQLDNLWSNRKRHGANRRKFGKHQEKILDTIVRIYVPVKLRPKKDRPLVIDKKFITYCKAVAWNRQKSLGKKITKERDIRSGMASLSEYNYLGATG